MVVVGGGFVEEGEEFALFVVVVVPWEEEGEVLCSFCFCFW